MPRRKNHFNDNLKKEFPFIIQIEKTDDTVVKCNICKVEFNLAVGGRAAINKHCQSNKHNSCRDAAASSIKLTTFLRNTTFSSDEKKLAIAEGTMAYHAICHNQSFRSMDCTSNLIRKLFNSSFTCARTKCERIVVSVFKKFSDDLLEADLKETNFVTILSDASNHNELKLYPVLIRYFNAVSGVQTKILDLSCITGETSEILSKHIFDIVKKRNLSEKVLALSADNTNTNFGGVNRRGENNVHKKLMLNLNKSIIGIGCNAHIISNAINTASSVMSIDVEVIIPQIYLHFNRFTVRVTKLQELCSEADVQYKKLLGFSKVRWLALTPAIERIIQLFDPLRTYFLSIEKCPKILKDFFENEVSEIMLFFVHNQAVLFSSAIKKIEKNNIPIAEVVNIINDLKDMYISRYNENFVPMTVGASIKKLEESKPGITRSCSKEMLIFYKTCFEYLEQWTRRLCDFSNLEWTLLRKQINWNDVQETIKFFEENNIRNVCDNELFDEVRRLNKFCEKNEMFNKWSESDIDADKRWVEIFKFFKTEHIPFNNLKILVEAAMCLPGTNASVERTFSIINDFWGCKKSRISVETLSAVISTKENLKMYNCEEFIKLLNENEYITKAIHSSNKYV